MNCTELPHIETKQYTLVIPYDSKNTHVLLGLKKRGFGVGKHYYVYLIFKSILTLIRWNGFGGKVMENESINACAARELKEECGIEDAVLEKMAILLLKWERSACVTEIHVYKATQFLDKPKESEEMIPQWFSVDPSAHNSIPYDHMWEEARIWYPEFHRGRKFVFNVLFKGDIDISDNAPLIIHYHLTPVENIHDYTYTDHLFE